MDSTKVSPNLQIKLTLPTVVTAVHNTLGQDYGLQQAEAHRKEM